MNLRFFDTKAVAFRLGFRVRNKSLVSAASALLCLGLVSPAHLQAQASAPASARGMVRQYQAGEKIGYTISSFTQSRGKTTEYEARAEGVVRKDASGVFLRI